MRTCILNDKKITAAVIDWPGDLAGFVKTHKTDRSMIEIRIGEGDHHLTVIAEAPKLEDRELR